MRSHNPAPHLLCTPAALQTSLPAPPLPPQIPRTPSPAPCHSHTQHLATWRLYCTTGCWVQPWVHCVVNGYTARCTGCSVWHPGCAVALGALCSASGALGHCSGCAAAQWAHCTVCRHLPCPCGVPEGRVTSHHNPCQVQDPSWGCCSGAEPLEG